MKSEIIPFEKLTFKGHSAADPGFSPGGGNLRHGRFFLAET